MGEADGCDLGELQEEARCTGGVGPCHYQTPSLHLFAGDCTAQNSPLWVSSGPSWTWWPAQDI